MLGRRAPKSVEHEARHGLAWLDKMWDAEATRPSTSRSASARATRPAPSAATTTCGGCRRPTTTSRATSTATSRTGRCSVRPLRERRSAPTWSAASRPPSPSRLRSTRSGTRVRARRELRQAKLLYAQADTDTPPEELVTALPHAFYPEDAWRDDMELGATEIALASRSLGMERSSLPARCREVGARLHQPRDRRHAQPLRHERAGACRPGQRCLKHTRRPHGPGGHPAPTSSPISVASSSGALDKSRRDPFGAGGAYDNFDVNSHTFASDRHRRPLPPARRSPRGSTGSRRRSATGCSAATRGASARWSAWARRSRSACSTRSPTSSGTTDGTPPIDVGRGRQRAERRRRSSRTGSVATRTPWCTARRRRAAGTAPFDGRGSRLRRRRPVVADRRARPRHDGSGDHRRCGPDGGAAPQLDWTHVASAQLSTRHLPRRIRRGQRLDPAVRHRTRDHLQQRRHL